MMAEYLRRISFTWDCYSYWDISKYWSAMCFEIAEDGGGSHMKMSLPTVVFIFLRRHMNFCTKCNAFDWTPEECSKHLKITSPVEHWREWITIWQDSSKDS